MSFVIRASSFSMRRPPASCPSRSSRRGIPALSRERAQRFAAHAQGVSPGIDWFPRGKQNVVEKMHSRRFSQLPFCGHETRAGAFVRATAILSTTHLLSVSRARKQLRHNPVREVQLPKMEKKLPLVLTRQQVGRASDGANTRAKEPICAVVDASARCRHHGIVLQQRVAPERTGCA